MAMDLATTPDETPATTAEWSQTKRIAFRFFFVYFTLYCLSNQIINSVFIVPKIDIPDWATLWPVRLWIIWVAHHIFRVKTDLVYSGSGSGDKVFDWVLVFCLLVVAFVATVLWSVLDRKRTSYPVLGKWFLLFLRVCLAGQMLTYGSVKVIPLQMPFPYPFKFLEPLRSFSPMGVLWTSVGVSPAYEVFTGCAELTAGFLLIFPRTATLGALAALADLVQVFVLNMTYDVCVKLLSFQLIILSLLLLAPNIQRLFNFFFRSQPAALAAAEPLLRSPRANRIARAVLAALWLWIIANNIYGDWDGWHKYGSGQPQSALGGIWTIQKLAIDGQPQPLLASNPDEWRRISFDLANWAHIQHMDDSLASYNAALDAKNEILALTTPRDKHWQANFNYTRPARDALLLDGTVNGHKQHIELKLMDSAQFLLTSRGFHWVQDYPFNR